MRHSLAVSLILALGTVVTVWLQARPGLSAQEPVARKRNVEKTDEQWVKLLSNEQFLVTRRKATEPPFSGKYVNNHAKGTYACVCCGAELFGSQAKFESGTGWPSFFQPASPKNIEQAPDYELGEPRVEVRCSDCGAHLGHVFSDGPPPTGLRYCINSAALKFKPVTAATSATARARGKTKARPKAKNAPDAAGEAPSRSDAPAPPATPAGKNEQGADRT